MERKEQLTQCGKAAERLSEAGTPEVCVGLQPLLETPYSLNGYIGT